MNIQEVARQAEVSTATVSRTINKPEAVDPITAARVWKVIGELNYLPNTQARSLVSGRSRIIGLIVSDITNPFFPELIKGFEEVATESGYEILISSTNYDSARTALCVRRMLERKVDGVAIMTSEMDKLLVDQLVHRGVPVVFLDVGTVHKHISNIRVNYAKGIGEAVEHLLALGHRRIAFISGPLGLKSARTRRTAFLRCLDKFGIIEDDRMIQVGDHTVDGGFQAMQRLLALPLPPTAVLASNDLTAIGTMRAVRGAGLRVPEDISTVGFDDIHLAEFTEPPLTTVRLPRDETARKAFDALLFDINSSRLDDAVHGAEHEIDTFLIVRESTGPVASPKPWLMPAS